MMMTRVRLSQNSSVYLEHARRLGHSDKQLLEWIEHNDMTTLQEADDEYFHYADWVSYAQEHGEDLKKAVQEGYQMTFNTVYGLKRWLKERFSFTDGEDYTSDEGRMDGMLLSDPDITLLKQTVASNWVVVENAAEGGSDKQAVSLVMRAIFDANTRL
ncbi:hypothetical protein [Paenibacillus marinisediminis]